MSETVFFDQNGVSVSNARFIVNGQTYAMNGVTSVKQAVVKPNQGAPALIGVIGLALLIMRASPPVTIFGCVLLAVAALVLFTQKASYVVVLHTSAGEMEALTSSDLGYIDGVIQALNDSIVHRG